MPTLTPPPLSKKLRWILRIFVLLLTVAVFGLSWYGYKKGLTKRWRETVFQEFRRHGVEVAFQKLTLDPFRGLVAREVSVFDTNDRHRVIAKIDKVVLSVDLSRLANGRPFLTALELRDARLSLPLEADHAKGQRLDIQHLSARLFFPNREIQVAQAEARVLGCRIKAQGWLANPGRIQATPTPDQGEPAWTRVAKGLVNELKNLRVTTAPPLIEVTFSGDVSLPDSLRASVNVSADDIFIRDLSIDSAELVAVWQGDAWELQTLLIEDPQDGTLRASGRWNPSNYSCDLSLESTLDPMLIGKSLGLEPFLVGATFSKRPKLQLFVKAEPAISFLPKITAHADVPEFRRGGKLRFDWSASASWESGQWSIRDFECTDGQGKISGDVLRTHKEFRCRLQSNLRSNSLAELLPEDIQGALFWLRRESLNEVHVELTPSIEELLSARSSNPTLPKPSWYASLLPEAGAPK